MLIKQNSHMATLKRRLAYVRGGEIFWIPFSIRFFALVLVAVCAEDARMFKSVPVGAGHDKR